MDEKQIMEMFATPDGPVPPVDPRDVRAAWERQRQIERDHPGQLCAVAGGDNDSKSDANVRAVGYRATILGMVCHVMPEALLWTEGAEIFRAIAEVPMEWIGEGVRQGWPFDPDDFVRRVREA